MSASALGAAVAAVLLLTGCTGGGAPEPSPSSSSPSPEETSQPDPVLDPTGTAEQNLDYFDFVNGRLLADNADPDGRALIDNLVVAGFDKAAMEVTPDRTAVDLDADNVQFAVRFAEACLVGQVGNTGYVSSVAPLLGTGKCLVGTTRPIDW